MQEDHVGSMASAIAKHHSICVLFGCALIGGMSGTLFKLFDDLQPPEKGIAAKCHKRTVEKTTLCRVYLQLLAKALEG